MNNILLYQKKMYFCNVKKKGNITTQLNINNETMDEEFTLIEMADEFTGFECPWDGLTDIEIEARLETLSDE